MKQDNKIKVTVSLSKDAYAGLMSRYKEDGSTTRSEFVERAILHYCGYLSSKDDTAYLPQVLGTIIGGHLGRLELAVCRYLGKLAVEMDVNSHINATQSDISNEDYYKLRKLAEREVQQSGGNISFAKALAFQRGEDE